MPQANGWEISLSAVFRVDSYLFLIEKKARESHVRGRTERHK